MRNGCAPVTPAIGGPLVADHPAAAAAAAAAATRALAYARGTRRRAGPVPVVRQLRRPALSFPD